LKSLLILIRCSHIANDVNVNAIDEDLKYKNVRIFSQKREETSLMHAKNA